MFALALATAGLPCAPLAAQPDAERPAPAPQTALEQRSEQVVAVLRGEQAPEDLFSKEFLAAVPAAQLKALNASLASQFGEAVEVTKLDPREGTSAILEIRFERGLAKGPIVLDPAQDNRVSGLRFTQIEPLAVADDTPARITADLAALPGSVNAWFAPLDGGAPVISLGADQPLALGSAFKLYVLAALAEDVKVGRRKWSDVVPLTEKSYPSGQLQDWPKGAPVTLHTLASLMIAISDNTATDQLITVLGKKRILKLMKESGHHNPALNTPFLTTRELFLLKASDDMTISSWRSGSVTERAATTAANVAESMVEPVPLEDVNAAFGNGPKAIDIEWFASPADLARLFAHMRRTADPGAFDILAINPSANGETIRASWPYIGFKGGSEPGVLNYTWLLTDTAGRDWVLTLGWNNPEAVLDEGKLNAIAQRILLLPR
ncbi:putative beta-lactamase [Erythrobacter dokdonensis DSW-74]|uniref:Putative beta-lactamase n=1 Tax=Erythrobacter dokdonensis DSW-74 TaxID=1300349 RepID=A0A1A7BLM1_9SPHN|nr:putative beta-lactamase [Erythrobacter dokdonensis DSW-74]